MLGSLFRVLIGSIILIVIIFAALSAYHWSNGASADDAVSMSVQDAKVAVECPHKPGTVVDFMQRNDLESIGVDVASELGFNWAEEVCDGVLERI